MGLHVRPALAPVLPGAVTVIGGLIVLASSYRPAALFGGWLAALGGAWFAVGSVLAPAWHGGSVTAGTPVGGTLTRAVEQIGFFTGLGIVIVLFAAMALGRLSVISVRDARLAERAAEEAATEAASEPTTGRFALRRPAADARTAETGSPGPESGTPDTGPVGVSADPAAVRVDSASAAP